MLRSGLNLAYILNSLAVKAPIGSFKEGNQDVNRENNIFYQQVSPIYDSESFRLWVIKTLVFIYLRLSLLWIALFSFYEN